MSVPQTRVDPGASSASRLALEDPATLSRLRRELFESIGPLDGQGVMYGLSFCEGMIDGLRVMQTFSDAGHGGAATGTPLPIVFRPEGGVLATGFAGNLARSLEAEVHQQDYPPSADPVCFVSGGYAAGWYSAILGETILVREVSCTACGDAGCRFEARPADEWLAQDHPWAEALLPFLDLESIQERALQRSREPEPELKEGDMLGHFDPMSPAVHVWGPVMVLPYSGAEDGLLALDTVLEDVGRDQIRVVVVDATGAVIDPVEAVGLTRLIDALNSTGIETVMTGIGDRAARYFQTRGGGGGLPLMAHDLSEAIVLGFQLSQARRTSY